MHQPLNSQLRLNLLKTINNQKKSKTGSKNQRECQAARVQATPAFRQTFSGTVVLSTTAARLISNRPVSNRSATLLAVIAFALGASAQNPVASPTVLKAKTCAITVDTEWNKHHVFNPKVEGDAVFLAIHSTALYRKYRQVDAAHADLILHLTDSELMDTISLEVLNPDDNSRVWYENRSRVAIDNDVKRLIAHFLSAVNEAVQEDVDREQLRDLAARLPLTWQGENAKPNSPPIDVWIAGDNLYETRANQVALKDENVLDDLMSCTTVRKGSKWDGTCSYSLTLSKADNTESQGKKIIASCKVTTREIVTEVSETRVAGRSQRIDYTPLTIAGGCPIAGTEYVDFVYVPMTGASGTNK